MNETDEVGVNIGGRKMDDVTGPDRAEASKKADFETAIEATGFGKFNLILLIIGFSSSLSQVVETISLSYVLPVAQCDLSLTLEDKGMLNAVTFAGMIASGAIFGSLCDIWGRKKMIIFGYMVQAFITTLASLSQTFTMLMIAKFFSGFTFNGGFSAFTAYLSECHSSKYRGIVQIMRGFGVALGNIIVPVLALGILPRNINIVLFDYLNIHSWNIFILVSAFAPSTCALAFIFMPESPKFLMSSGKNEEALEILKRIYMANSGKSAESYPIKELVNEGNETRRKSVDKIKAGLMAFKPLFTPPYLYKLILVCSYAFTLIMGHNSLKLWFPQLLQSINDYEMSHNGSTTDMCNIVESLSSTASETASSACVVNFDNMSVYINAIIVGFAQVVTFFVAGFIINLIGKKFLSVITSLIAGVCVVGIYFAKNSAAITALFAIFLPFLELTGNTAVTMTLEIFPTTFRTTALSLHLMIARIGSITGNMLFPSLISLGCLPPFAFCAGLAFVLPIFLFFYPNTENKALV